MATATTIEPTTRRRRLRRSDCSGPGLRRLRRGRGFSYLDSAGDRVTDEEMLARIRSLTIPPAWEEVWICVDPLGHLQATGIDAAGRKQYLYHERWREQRDRQKFEKMLRFAKALPSMRRNVAADLSGEEINRDRVLACAVRMLDVGLFRIGSEEYADSGGGLGLTTLGRDHVTVKANGIAFDYPAKSGVRRVHAIDDPDCVAVVRALGRRRGGPPELLAYREGRRWTRVDAEDVNEYLKLQVGEDFSAKDFRTWNGTVLAAVALAASGREARTKTARKRAIDGAVREVAEMLGNTPAVARRAYIDPRVFDRYRSGWTIRSTLERIDGLGVAGDRTRTRIERAVVDLLAGEEDSPAIELSVS
jgi:DNA topoisomerase I